MAILGGWSTDNSGNDILVNGHSTGQTSPSYSSLTPFSLSGVRGFLRPASNTLDFQWSNAGGPGGVAIEFTSATANPVADAGVPEPGSLVLLGGGVVGPGMIRRRKSA